MRPIKTAFITFAALSSALAYSGDIQLTSVGEGKPRVNPVVYSMLKPFQFAGKIVDLNNPADLDWLSKKTAEMVLFLKESKSATTLPENYPEYMSEVVQDKKHISKKSTIKGLIEMGLLADVCLDVKKKSSVSKADELNCKDASVNILELNASLNMNLRQPAPDMTLVQVGKELKTALKKEKFGIMGNLPATNLSSSTEKDLSKVDPVESTFWFKPGSISSKDLYYGYERKTGFISTHDRICKYVKPKKSSGSHVGFTINCDGKEMKAKFADFHTEPFNSRLFHAFGFDTNPTDYMTGLKLSYDRKILTEINSRILIELNLILPSIIPDIKIATITAQVNAFNFIKEAVLKDGSRLAGEALKKFLLSRKMLPEDQIHLKDADFNPESEAKIDHLVFIEGQLQQDPDNISSIGPWEINDLGHDDRRELRGMALLGGWLGLSSMRYDDARLIFIKQADGSYRFLHRFNELGTGLGMSKSLLKKSTNNPNDMDWKFTEPSQNIETKEYAVRIIDYKTLAPITAFQKMTIDDARWMARIIGQLTEDQIVSALIAAGYNSEWVKLYAEKLISRRNAMIADLKLEKEYPPIKTEASQLFNYDPKKDGPISAKLPDGKIVTAPVGDGFIKDGVLFSSELGKE